MRGEPDRRASRSCVGQHLHDALLLVRAEMRCSPCGSDKDSAVFAPASCSRRTASLICLQEKGGAVASDSGAVWI